LAHGGTSPSALLASFGFDKLAKAARFDLTQKQYDVLASSSAYATSQNKKMLRRNIRLAITDNVNKSTANAHVNLMDYAKRFGICPDLIKAASSGKDHWFHEVNITVSLLLNQIGDKETREKRGYIRYHFEIKDGQLYLAHYKAHGDPYAKPPIPPVLETLEHGADNEEKLGKYIVALCELRRISKIAAAIGWSGREFAWIWNAIPKSRNWRHGFNSQTLTKAKAEAYRDALAVTFIGERYFNPNTNPTVAEVVDHWLDNKRGSVKAQTIRGYLPLLKNITGPILQGTPQEKVHYALTGEKPSRESKLLQMLGPFKVSELTTAQLRRWHSLIRTEAGHHTANRVMSMLKGILALAEEDFGVRMCSMPTNLARRESKPKKEIMKSRHKQAKMFQQDTKFLRQKPGKALLLL